MQQPATLTPSLPAEWKNFLETQGAVFDADRVAHFGQPGAEARTARDGDVLADLSQLALLRVDGTDRDSFLQGQLSNDIRIVDATHAQLSAYCNPKGRMFAVFLVFKRDDALYLQLPSILAESVTRRLRMFVLRAKVKLEPAEADLLRIGLSGPNAAERVHQTLGHAPESPYDSFTANSVTAIRLPGPHPRFEIVAPAASMPTLWKQLAKAATPVGNGPWAWLDIEAGLPTILPATSEEFVPQMANLELVGGVSFTKGCYPGQEIVARMHYLGRLKQRMHRGHVETQAAPQAGDKLYVREFGEQSAGMIVDAQPSPDRGYDLLAVVQQELAANGEFHLGGISGPVVRLAPVPYPFPEPK